MVRTLRAIQTFLGNLCLAFFLLHITPIFIAKARVPLDLHQLARQHV